MIFTLAEMRDLVVKDNAESREYSKYLLLSISTVYFLGLLGYSGEDVF